MNDEQLAKALGWFSLGLGFAGVVAPDSMARTIGLKDTPGNRGLLRFVGVREILCGLDILTRPKPVGAVQARVAGDVMDLAVLGMALSSDDNERDRVATATAAVIGVTVLDVFCSKQLSRHSKYGNGTHETKNGAQNGTNGRQRKGQAMDVKETITINKPVEELYSFWHDFENLPHFMYHLESVQVTDNGRSHWKAKAPAGATVEWDAEVTDDQPNRRIAWRSLEGADVPNSGSVSFEAAPGGRGTVVRVEMNYSPPGGAVGAGIAKLLGEEPEKQVWEDLHRFKQLMEVGEIVRSEGSPEGMGSPQRPAQSPAALAAVGTTP